MKPDEVRPGMRARLSHDESIPRHLRGQPCIVLATEYRGGWMEGIIFQVSVVAEYPATETHAAGHEYWQTTADQLEPDRAQGLMHWPMRPTDVEAEAAAIDCAPYDLQRDAWITMLRRRIENALDGDVTRTELLELFDRLAYERVHLIHQMRVQALIAERLAGAIRGPDHPSSPHADQFERVALRLRQLADRGGKRS
jgi:hypothetical protein